jgi:hypothetical protein
MEEMAEPYVVGVYPLVQRCLRIFMRYPEVRGGYLTPFAVRRPQITYSKRRQDQGWDAW